MALKALDVTYSIPSLGELGDILDQSINHKKVTYFTRFSQNTRSRLLLSYYHSYHSNHSYHSYHSYHSNHS